VGILRLVTVFWQIISCKVGIGGSISSQFSPFLPSFFALLFIFTPFLQIWRHGSHDSSKIDAYRAGKSTDNRSSQSSIANLVLRFPNVSGHFGRLSASLRDRTSSLRNIFLSAFISKYTKISQ